MDGNKENNTAKLFFENFKKGELNFRKKYNGYNVMEINRDLLTSYYIFKPSAPLKLYLKSKLPELRERITLTEVLTMLKKIISNEKMFDQQNPAIIICSKQLETALNMRALHVTEIRKLVVDQLLLLPESCQMRLRSSTWDIIRYPCNKSPEALPPLTVCEPTTSLIGSGDTATTAANLSTKTTVFEFPVSKIDPAIYRDKNSLFKLKPDFLAALASLPNFCQNQTIFSYYEVTLLLSKYILSKKDVFFDPRNIRLAMVNNDPLGKAFQVKAFHRCQVTNLLQKQLIHVTKCDDENTATSSQIV